MSLLLLSVDGLHAGRPNGVIDGADRRRRTVDVALLRAAHDDQPLFFALRLYPDANTDGEQHGRYQQSEQHTKGQEQFGRRQAEDGLRRDEVVLFRRVTQRSSSHCSGRFFQLRSSNCKTSSSNGSCVKSTAQLPSTLLKTAILLTTAPKFCSVWIKCVKLLERKLGRVTTVAPRSFKRPVLEN